MLHGDNNKNKNGKHLKDPCRNLVKKWNNVNTVNGVFSDEFQLSDLPNLGEWKITAQLNNEQVCDLHLTNRYYSYTKRMNNFAEFEFE